MPAKSPSSSSIRSHALSLLLMVGIIAAPAAEAQDHIERDRSDIPFRTVDTGRTAPVPGQLVVRFKGGSSTTDQRAAHRATGARVVQDLVLPRTKLVSLPASTSLDAAISSYRQMPSVDFVEPNYIYHLDEVIPIDTQFSQLWGLRNTGQTVQGISGSPDADIDATEAWIDTTGSSNVVVGVVDSGIAYDHPDLASNMWTNPGETDNGLDDDANGLADDLIGWDWHHDDDDPRDENGHGTHVAGTIGAQGDNGFGVTGVTWDVQLAALRVCSPVGLCTTADLTSALAYAGQKGMDVVNASLSGFDNSAAVSSAIAAAPDTLFVVAAGNDGRNNDTTPAYPCSLTSPNLICVAATTQTDALAPFSNYGSTSTDLGAPGTGVLSTFPRFTSLFFDNLSAGSSNWAAGKASGISWARTSERSSSPSYSLTDSTGGNYQNNSNTWIDLINPVNLSDRRGCRLTYQMRLATENPFDGLVVDGSTDGVSWTPLNAWTGSTTGSFFPFEEDLSSLSGSPSARVSFRLVSDGSVTQDGAHVDDVRILCPSTSGTFSQSDVAYLDGTSMAAPHVTGAAALLLSMVPATSVAALKHALLVGGDPKSSLSGKTVTGKRLNVRTALDMLLPWGLTVQRSGTGTGTVTSTPAGVACGSDCSHRFLDGTGVGLTAVAATGSQFMGWSGDCTGSEGCILEMTADRSVTATFTDIDAPETTIVSGPEGVAYSSSATFSFSADEVGSTFECALDEQGFAPCSNPESYPGLAVGEHTFQVRATDPGGNLDASPATRTWMVDVPSAKSVSLSASKRSVKKRRRFTLTARVSPCEGHEGDLVRFQKKTSSGWRTIATRNTSSTCTASLRLRMRKTTVFRAVSPQQDEDHLQGVSASKRVRRKR